MFVPLNPAVKFTPVSGNCRYRFSKSQRLYQECPKEQWISNEASAECMLCATKFGVLSNRKHHVSPVCRLVTGVHLNIGCVVVCLLQCRHCGLLVCGECASKVFPLLVGSPTPTVASSRVCDGCFNLHREFKGVIVAVTGGMRVASVDEPSGQRSRSSTSRVSPPSDDRTAAARTSTSALRSTMDATRAGLSERGDKLNLLGMHVTCVSVRHDRL